jgi:hypothetical protein
LRVYVEPSAYTPLFIINIARATQKGGCAFLFATLFLYFYSRLSIDLFNNFLKASEQ